MLLMARYQLVKAHLPSETKGDNCMARKEKGGGEVSYRQFNIVKIYYKK